MKLVNLTGKDLVIRALGDDGALVELKREGAGARVPPSYLDLGEPVALQVNAHAWRGVPRGSNPGGGDVVFEAKRPGPHSVAVRAVAWGPRIDNLPDPRPGIGLVVTSHVAETAVLVGRNLDDLFVAIQIDRDASDAIHGRVHASLAPAATASPAMRWLRVLAELQQHSQHQAGVIADIERSLS